MTTVDRVKPILQRPWTPASVALSGDEYVGKHRKPGHRTFSLRRAFYLARHAR